jgi:hypothetical protein
MMQANTALAHQLFDLCVAYDCNPRDPRLREEIDRLKPFTVDDMVAVLEELHGLIEHSRRQRH